MGHVKPGFVVLVTLTLLVFIIAYVYDFSLMPVTTCLAKINVWNFFNNLQTIQTTTTVEKPSPSIRIEHISIHQYVAHPSNYHFILDEPDKCSQNPFLVLMVPVAPQQLDAHNAIWSTWGNESSVQGKAVLTLFLVGLTRGPEAQQQLEEESRQHRDLVQSNFVDSYFNLTIKTMVIMDWLATRCPQANFRMKVDSDMYIGLENLMTLLLAPNTPRQNYITGYLMWNQNVITNKNSKWYVSEAIKPFNIEDAYVGTCLKRLGINPSGTPDPSQFQTYMNNPKSHDLSKLITTITGEGSRVLAKCEGT
uniref:Hexosyltransferase n=1 Tax=Sinocyclocheilus grahami TaxID=75366 RepID=A0A672K821_SINGR